ncbi:uncharacterized protein MELLADRAFT_112811 [Melampsora larici-populina 98AG31]|uniref:Uncharacterized protein n=1 Tax=Melampsora larici-populina (strain 98AG31 / pathotype 3-4-7) TaxID=747676 RepID=F4S7P6_MELLP|nr:uncharacterized protein MELLADRAFT_112811 [Melampsora larici-populina 98AG31]EGF99355.1 hypothetical protein MELLADRAFT_112811 [Melampsora larici-populina 98AG31]
MNQVTNPIKKEEFPKPINFETKNLTREEIELLMIHTHNFMKWEKAKKEKDPVGFKRTTIKAKELHRKLTSKIGISRVLEETHGWNPLEWDWITFEKKQRELVKGHQRELLRTLEQTPRLSKAELKAILDVVIRTLDD